MHGCLPVIIMDNVDEKFANVVDYDAFSVRIAERDIAKVLSSPAREPDGKREVTQCGQHALFRASDIRRAAALCSSFLFCSSILVEGCSMRGCCY